MNASFSDTLVTMQLPYIAYSVWYYEQKCWIILQYTWAALLPFSILEMENVHCLMSILSSMDIK